MMRPYRSRFPTVSVVPNAVQPSAGRRPIEVHVTQPADPNDPGPGQRSPSVARVYDRFVADTFSDARTPLRRSRSFYELCPFGVADLPSPPPPVRCLSIYPERRPGPLTSDLAVGGVNALPRPRRSRSYGGGRLNRVHGDYQPSHFRRQLLDDGDRLPAVDRSTADRIDRGRGWDRWTKSVYPTSWENSYLIQAQPRDGLRSLISQKSVFWRDFANNRSRQAAMMAATLRTSPDFWTYTFPNMYPPSNRLSEKNYYFSYGYR